MNSEDKFYYIGLAIVIIAGLVGTYFVLTYKPKMEETITELQTEDITVGEGAEVKSGDKVKVHYVGTLEDGTEFDSNTGDDEPFEFTVGAGQVIDGWDQGIPGMKVGGKRKLTIPSDLGYGDTATGSIPANSTLIFEVELVEIVAE